MSGRQDSVIKCMFWCMFAADVNAIYCDVLLNRNGAQVFHSVIVMRIHASTCGLLQHSEIWTQNPPPSLAYEFDSRSRHHYNQQLRAKIPKRKPVKRPSPPTLASHGGSTPSRHQHKTFEFNKLARTLFNQSFSSITSAGGWCMF
jgi:hypothetical protein